MKVNNEEITYLVEKLQTKSNDYRAACQKQISEISEIITSLHEIQDVEETAGVEKVEKEKSS